MVVIGNLARFTGSGGTILTTSAMALDIVGYATNKTNLDIAPLGGTLYLNENKINCHHTNGYNEIGIFDLEIAREKLYEDEGFAQINNVKYLGNDLFDIVITTDFGTKINYRTKLNISKDWGEKDFVLLKEFGLEVIDFKIIEQGKEIIAQDIFDYNFISGYYFNNKAISVKLDSDSDFSDDYNQSQRNNVQERFDKLLENELPVIREYFRNTSYKFVGWAGEGHKKELKDYKLRNGKGVDTQLHNNPLDAGEFVIGKTFSLKKEMPIYPSQVTWQRIDDSYELLSPYDNPNEIYTKCVLGNKNEKKKYAILPENMTSYIYSGNFVWIKDDGWILGEE